MDTSARGEESKIRELLEPIHDEVENNRLESLVNNAASDTALQQLENVAADVVADPPIERDKDV